MVPHLLLFHRNLLLVVQLGVGDHATRRSNLFLVRFTELLRCAAHILAFIFFLLQIHSTHPLHMRHLILQVLLHLLILAVLGHVYPLRLNLVLASVFIDHLAPELVLLLILECAEASKLGLAEPIVRVSSAHLRDAKIVMLWRDGVRGRLLE